MFLSASTQDEINQHIRLLALIDYASCGGSDEPAQMCSLARAFVTARTHNMFMLLVSLDSCL